jgi:hypothetical protein
MSRCSNLNVTDLIHLQSSIFEYQQREGEGVLDMIFSTTTKIVGTD